MPAENLSNIMPYHFRQHCVMIAIQYGNHNDISISYIMWKEGLSDIGFMSAWKPPNVNMVWIKTNRILYYPTGIFLEKRVIKCYSQPEPYFSDSDEELELWRRNCCDWELQIMGPYWFLINGIIPDVSSIFRKFFELNIHFYVGL